MSKRIAALSLCILLYACSHGVKPLITSTPPASPETHVAYRTKLDPATPAYQEQNDNETYNTPVTLDNPPPRYPLAMVARHLPLVTVAVKVIVNTSGVVDEVRIAPNADLATHPVEFDDAVRDALLHWRYTPLRYTRWERVIDNQGNEVDARVIAAETKPFSMDYEFRFELHDGKPIVEGAAR